MRFRSNQFGGPELSISGDPRQRSIVNYDSQPSYADGSEVNNAEEQVGFASR